MGSEFQKERRTILVSGGGIAGLASALFVSRAGYRVEVFEQTPKLDPIGSGLQLSPNAMHVLAALELERQVETLATAPPGINIRNGLSGRKITEIPLGEDVVSAYGQPYLVIHRADLQNILFEACERDPDIQLRMGVIVRDAVSHHNGITVIADSANGTDNYRGIGLIGADGVNSVVRNECFECKGVKSTGTHALRALVKSTDIPAELHDGKIHMWLAPNAHAVVYPVRRDDYYNIVLTVPEAFSAQVGYDEPLVTDLYLTGPKIAAGLTKWNIGFKKLLNANTQWTKWPLSGAPDLKKWQEGCIVLVGDAAHAMTPHAAQGAAMGLEDAAVLGWAIDSTRSLVQAFELYQNQRIKRTGAVKRFSEVNRVIFQLPQPLATLRNIGMFVIGGGRISNRQDWIYRWKPPINIGEIPATED